MKKFILIGLYTILFLSMALAVIAALGAWICYSSGSDEIGNACAIASGANLLSHFVFQAALMKFKADPVE